MSDVTVSIKVREFFFDSDGVVKKTSEKARSTLRTIGSRTRRKARDLIRFTKKRASKPGQPPRSHTKHPFASIRNIVYAYEPARQGVVIGPMAIQPNTKVPSTLEGGGRVRYTMQLRPKYYYHGRKIKAQWKLCVGDNPRRVRIKNRKLRTSSAKIAARPYMGPAWQKVQPTVQNDFRGLLGPG